jgi:putative membrane protein
MKLMVIEFLKTYKTTLLIAFLLIFYSVGIIGISLPQTRSYFLSLSPLNLVLSFVVLILAMEKNYRNGALFFLLCYLVGMTVELIGTKTGWLFGNYWYGLNLGPKFLGVPLVIGVNWWVLVVCSASIVNHVQRISILWRVLFAGALMTIFDVLMEPIAMKSDFWQWENNQIPLYNYICWFLISLPLHYLYVTFKLVESNKVYPVLFFVMTLFFIILYFI